jgi:pyruvate/2-oxoglutarate/acetoin dehydrogenase E1 component
MDPLAKHQRPASEPKVSSDAARRGTSTLTVLQAVQAALAEEMERDQNVVLLGEDVAAAGGVFRATEGLLGKFGAARVIDTPLNESGIVGVAIGMALYGLKPVAEIQFADFIYPAFDQIVSELAKLRYRSGGEFACPVVVRTPAGGGIRGGGYHSQSPEAYFVHTAGLHVYAPSTPADAKGLLKSAIRGSDPVIFFEPKRIYRTVKDEVPDDHDFLVEPGQARVAREGADVALISYGAAVHTCLEAAGEAAKQGVEAAVIDLRTLAPLDVEAILEAARRCGRVVIVSEAPRTCSVASEISALIAEGAVDSLEAPIVRVTGFDTPFPYALEPLYMPSARRVLAAIEQVLDH